MWWAIGVFCLVLCGSNTLGQEGSLDQDQVQDPTGKSLSLFNLVKFDNVACHGTKRNGTCYTKQECKDRGGKEEKTCAEGFGVCCVIELACGKSSSDNNTFLVNTAVKAGKGCTYTICPAASKICRIRYDFTENTLAAPVAVKNGFNAAAANGITPGATGSCTTDSMTITNSGAASSPVICGANKGQHMILDSDGIGCQEVVFQVGHKALATRKWDIHVTQYTCTDMDHTKSGPKGCLQFFTGDTGHMRSFNFPDVATVGSAKDNVKKDFIHLNNQDYSVCVRKNPSKTKICYTPLGSAAIGNTGTFGVSRETADTKKAEASVDSACVSDWLEFPTGYSVAGAKVAATTDLFKMCGRFIGTSTHVNSHVTACQHRHPYQFRVHFDASEIGTAKGLTTTLKTDEHVTLKNGGPGTIGFLFEYKQT